MPSQPIASTSSRMETGLRAFIPDDRYNFVFLIFLVNGIGTLLPWNMLINAEKYFTDYKLNTTDASDAVHNYNKYFLSYIGIASKAPNILLQIVNMFINAHEANFSLRIIYTLIIQIGVFLFIILFACIDTTSWPEIFFWCTMGAAAVINLANGVYQGCVYGLAARFPMKYTNSITIGMNLSGTLASVLSILAIMVSPSTQIEAIVFFSCAVILLGLCLFFEFVLKKMTFYNFYAHPKSAAVNAGGSEAELEDDSFDGNIPRAISETTTYGGKPSSGYIEELKQTPRKKYLYILKKIWVQLLNIILIYMVSLSIFPAMAAHIIQHDKWFSSTYFTPVFCFLFFNLFATIGNFIAQFIQWPGPRYLIVFSVLRLLFIPYFLMCNYFPSADLSERVLPVYFQSDIYFILGMICMAVSSGYFSSLTMMYIPRCVHSEFAATAGMLGALTIILGILIGINFSIVYPTMVHYNLHL